MLWEAWMLEGGLPSVRLDCIAMWTMSPSLRLRLTAEFAISASLESAAGAFFAASPSDLRNHVLLLSDPRGA
jgi:hypothetical protein